MCAKTTMQLTAYYNCNKKSTQVLSYYFRLVIFEVHFARFLNFEQVLNKLSVCMELKSQTAPLVDAAPIREATVVRVLCLISLPRMSN
jgi:hypothetical protein